MKYAMVAANLNGKLLDFAFKEIVLKKKEQILREGAHSGGTTVSIQGRYSVRSKRPINVFT